MSIDAQVVGVSRYLTLQGERSGGARLTLEQPDRSRCAGRHCLAVVDPPDNLEILLGRHIWGGDDLLVCGEIIIGRCIGYSRARFYESFLERVKETGAGLPKKESA